MLPQVQGEIPVVLGKADHGLRAGQIAVESRVPTIVRSKGGLTAVKPNRCGRARMDQVPPGVFTITNGAGAVGD